VCYGPSSGPPQALLRILHQQHFDMDLEQYLPTHERLEACYGLVLRVGVTGVTGYGLASGLFVLFDPQPRRLRSDAAPYPANIASTIEKTVKIPSGR
jgi:hypothetical protein